MTTHHEHEAPETLEGWWMLHEAWTLDRTAWRGRDAAWRAAAASEAAAALTTADDGHSGVYAVVGQKADLLVVHYRKSAADLHAAGDRLRRTAAAADLRPAGSFVSVAEASLYEASGMAHGTLARRGLTPGSPEWDTALATEMNAAKSLLLDRVWKPLPPHRHLCWYPMNKRRGETVNWYSMPQTERRTLMRGHGQVGAKFRDVVVQVVSGSTGLDDWEWSVDLHSEDPLHFKKLVHAMRFDAASAKFAEFGPFWLGLRQDPAQVAAWFASA